MKFHQHFNLTKHNSFALHSTCASFYALEDEVDLNKLPDLSSDNFYILGEGSNTLFVDDTAPIIIKPEFKGINFQETEDYNLVSVAAGENWHHLIETCIAQGVYGLENLALIPGSVGAAPIQNIGAYGVEFADYCQSVTWYEFATQSIHTLDNSVCEFAYRDSVFKKRLKNKGIIISVTLRLPKAWQPNLTYHGLNHLASDISAADLMKEVIALREAKLPDPDLLANAGSFFKNPVVSRDQYQALLNEYPNLVAYPVSDTEMKLAAGWLIDSCNLKGYQQAGVGVHEKQALVLVNYAATQGQAIIDLASLVKQRVYEKFAVELEPEVRAVYAFGESPMKLRSDHD